MEQKNIAFAHESFPKGGAETVTSHISKYLIAKGYTIYVFAHEINKDQLMSGHAEVIFIQLPDSRMNTKGNADFLIKKINELHIQVLLSKDITTYLNDIKSNTSCKLIYTNHGVPLWEYTEEMTEKKEWIEKSFLKKIEWYVLRVPKNALLRKSYKKIQSNYKKIYHSVDAYTVLCDEYKKAIAKIVGVNDKSSKLYTLTNPTIKLSETINLSKKKQVIYTGRLTYRDKRVDRLLDIWNLVYAKFPDWELLIVGEGNDSENLKAKAKSLHLKNYRFCGYTPNIADYLQDASILCLTSAIESWGLSLTEAQIYGVVPIAFNCSHGVKKILSPSGTNGILVKSFHLKKYADQLSELMSNENRRKQIQMNIIKKSKEYSLENIGKQWEKMLETI